MSYWKATVEGKSYSVTIVDRFIQLTMSDGTKEGTGSSDVPAQRFLRSKRYRAHILEVYGQAVSDEIVQAAEKAAEIHITPRKRPNNSLQARRP
jgi:hypothetical protein